MSTYGSFTGQGAYRAHMDSRDFMRFLQTVTGIALVLSMLFSIRGNYLGLKQFMGNNWFYLICVSGAITLTSSILSMLTVFKLPGLNRSGRIMILITAIALFYASTRLTLIGFSTGEKQVKQLSFLEHPELGVANQRLASILNRQKSAELTNGERQSLMAREREERNYIRELETKLRREQKDETSSLEQATGGEALVARQIFSLTPDLCIAVLSPLLVVLFGLGGFSQVEPVGPGREQEQRIIYLPANNGQGQGQNQGQRPAVSSYQMPANSQPAARPEQVRQPVATDQGNGNGHIQGQGPGREQLGFNWDPFNGQ